MDLVEQESEESNFWSNAAKYFWEHFPGEGEPVPRSSKGFEIKAL